MSAAPKPHHHKLETLGYAVNGKAKVELTCGGCDLMETDDEGILACSECGAEYTIDEILEYLSEVGCAFFSLATSLAGTGSP